MTSDELNELGQKVFGKSWKSQLARKLGVNVSTVNRWTSDYTPISLKNEIAILTICETHLKTNGDAAAA